MQYIPLNLEQSIAKYLSDQFQSVGYSVYWFDTKQTEGSGTQVTIARRLPGQQASYARQSTSVVSPGIIKLPAFTVFVNDQKTDATKRLGLGDSEFIRNATVRVDGFADNELEWYKIRGWFSAWFGVDVRTTVYDYQADINDPNPSELNYQLQYLDTDVFGDELDNTPAARYYINMQSTLEFVE